MLTPLARNHGVPTIFQFRQFVAAGGLNELRLQW